MPRTYVDPESLSRTIFGYSESQLNKLTEEKPIFTMDEWWIEEYFPKDFIPYDRLRGLIGGRNRFENGEPVFYREPTYTSAILHIDGDKLETVNSIYILGTPRNYD